METRSDSLLRNLNHAHLVIWHGVLGYQETCESVAEMRILRWMCGQTSRERIRKKENLCVLVGIAPIKDKMIENRQRQFERVQCRLIDAVVRRSDMVMVDGSIKGRGRPRLTLETVIRKDLGHMPYCTFFFSFSLFF